MSDCGNTSTGLIPLTNPEGVGLYPCGCNVRPQAHTDAGITAAASFADAPSKVMVGLGPSVAKQAFSRFMYKARGRTAPDVQLVNCAAGGKTSENWANPSDSCWSGALSNLANAGASSQDVRVAWLKLTRGNPTGSVEAFIAALTVEWRAAIVNAATVFPNLQQLFLGCRSYGGYDNQNYNSEPYAHATGLVAKAMVAESIAALTRPWVDWGPYFWTDGMTPRAGDGLIWRCDPNPYKNGQPTYDAGDVKADGVHQTRNGEDKEAIPMLTFFETDPTTVWFNDR